MHPSDIDFALPADLIAQEPARPRDAARLLVAGGSGDAIADRHVADLPALLAPGDLLVANDTRVIPAALEALRRRGADLARVGLTLDMPRPDGSWRALARNARRLRAGDRLEITGTDMTATVLGEADGEAATGGAVALRFDREGDAFDAALRCAGRLALPPYIARAHGPTEADGRDYQTAFARHDGAVAAPTAGLHFTDGLLAALDRRRVSRCTVTLHVGAGTFLPVRTERIEDHAMHSERGVVGEEAASAIAACRARGGRVVAVGTTTLRVLEAAAGADGVVRPFVGETALFIRPPYRVRTADLLLTNFHLPRSTLLLLVAAFAGADMIRRAYAHAVARRYRFFSYGDACLLARTPDGADG